MKTVIINGGTIDDAFALTYIESLCPDYIIAADRGMEFCYRNHITPNCIIGDYDSVSAEVLSFFQKKEDIRWRNFEPEKDYTDSEIAVDTAIEAGSNAVHLLGATGTRLDHVLGNVQLLWKLEGLGIKGRMVDAHNRIRIVARREVLRQSDQFGKYVSILPLSTVIRGITLEGFKYPLHQATITSNNTLGISNEIAADTATITIEEGIAIVIESRD